MQAGDGSLEAEREREVEQLVRKEEKEENDLLLRNFKQEVAELRRQVRHLEIIHCIVGEVSKHKNTLSKTRSHLCGIRSIILTVAQSISDEIFDDRLS